MNWNIAEMSHICILKPPIRLYVSLFPAFFRKKNQYFEEKKHFLNLSWTVDGLSSFLVASSKLCVAF